MRIELDGGVRITADPGELDELVETIHAAQENGIAGGSILGDAGVAELLIVCDREEDGDAS